MSLWSILSRTGRTVPVCVLTGCVSVAAPGVDGPRADAGGTERGAVTVLQPYLAARIRALELKSPSFRKAMQALRAGDRPVYIGTPDQIGFDGRGYTLAGGSMSRTSLGDFAALRDVETDSVVALIVRINLKGLLSHYQRRVWFSRPEGPSVRQARFDQEVEAILIHELWGHLVPMATSSDREAACADPLPFEPPLQSCVMKRENWLRAEIGLKARESYQWDPGTP